MRLYGKYLLLAFVWGCCLSLVVVTKHQDVYSLQELVISIGFGYFLSCDQVTMLNLLEGMVPYYVFVIIFGTYIYRHFCWSSPYIFSRCVRRNQWMYQEMGSLFLFSALYMLCMTMGRMVPVMLRKGLSVDWAGIKMLFLLYGIMTLWIFSFALFCNMLSIWKGNVWGTISAITVNTLLVLSMVFVKTEEFADIEKIKLRINYCSHLVFGWHKFSGDGVQGMNQLGADISFFESYGYFIFVALVLMIVSVRMMEKRDII